MESHHVSRILVFILPTQVPRLPLHDPTGVLGVESPQVTEVVPDVT